LRRFCIAFVLEHSPGFSDLSFGEAGCDLWEKPWPSRSSSEKRFFRERSVSVVDAALRYYASFSRKILWIVTIALDGASAPGNVSATRQPF